MSDSTFSNNATHTPAFIVYINGIEVPCKSVSQRYGVWQIPEMQLEMVADPVLQRLGAEDRAQVAVFYMDDIQVHPTVTPAFRLFGEGEITGWGYQNTPSGRSITFTVVNQFAIFTQLYVHFLTSTDDMVGHFTGPDGTTGVSNATPEIIFPFSLFQQGVVQPPGDGTTTPEGRSALVQDPTTIVRPFDFLYNCVKNMIGAQVPSAQRALPAANFFTRWSRLTNFHNRFVAMPFFDEFADNPNIFPVLKAVQGTAALDAITQKLIPQVQNAGSLWDMIQLVYQTMFMEVAMLPAMPLLEVDLSDSLIRDTKFESHQLREEDGRWVSAVSPEDRKQAPLRLPNYFAKPQCLFGIPPACNVIFPSQLQMLAYQENFATQPTRMYFNDSVVTNILKADPTSGYTQAVSNVLATAYPFEADLKHIQGQAKPRVNGKNFLLFPEEFFKGPVMDRRPIPSWLFFLREHELAHAGNQERLKAEGKATTANTSTTASPQAKPRGTMVTKTKIGEVGPDGKRTFSQAVERLRPKVRTLSRQSGIPEDLLLAWVSHMSDGDFRKVAPPNRRGPFGILGPHLSGTTAVRLADTEAGEIGLSITDTGSGINEDGIIRLSTDEDFGLMQGVKLVQHYRRLANTAASVHQLNWSSGDMWRLTKLAHGTNHYALLLGRADTLLGRPPQSWEEFFTSVSSFATAEELTALQDATGVGGVAPGATGAMSDASGQITKSPTFKPAPGVISDAAGAAKAVYSAVVGKTTAEQALNAVAGLISPPESKEIDEVSAAEVEGVTDENRSVYQLYAQYEYFRERYSRRTGSAVLSWNPYIVPGFPAAIFDNRATRVDLVCYVTSVQQQMSHRGVATNLSFVYGRTFQEMFSLMRHDYLRGYNSVVGSSPLEPVRDIRRVIQDFGQSETLYQKMFYGGRRLYGKDAAFDFRRIIGFKSPIAGDAPEEIWINGPTESAADNLKLANKRLETFNAKRADFIAQKEKQQASLKETLDAIAIASKAPTTTQNKTILAQGETLRKQIEDEIKKLEKDIAITDDDIRHAASLKASSLVGNSVEVKHNLEGDRELAPLPSAAEMFVNYDAAMRYNWRPVCTLDEYIIFYNSAGEGTIPAFNHPRSTGAQYYSRIRKLTPLEPDRPIPSAITGTDLVPPPSTGGKLVGIQSGTGDYGQNGPTDFPQTRADWDKILLAYRKNVYQVLAPRK